MNRSLAVSVVILFTCLILAGIPSRAQDQEPTREPPKPSKPRDEVDPADIRISQADINRDLERIMERIRQDAAGKKLLLPTTYRGFSLTIKRYYDHPKLEEKTGYAKEWVGKNVKVLYDMFTARFKAKLAYTNRNREQFDSAMAEYQVACRTFFELLKNPERVKKK